jgi:two-component system response regulator FixJ
VHRKPIVYIVDDEPEVRTALKVTVELMGLEAATFASAQAFLDSYDPNQVGCLVVDLRMPEMSGQALLETLAARGASIPAIMVSGHGDIPAAVRALGAGAINFLEKPYKLDVLRESIVKAIELSRERMRESAEETAIQQRLEQLTPEERIVMHLTVAGKPDKAIAARLNLSVRTIQFRRASMMKKLNIRTRSQLVAIAQADTEPPAV